MQKIELHPAVEALAAFIEKNRDFYRDNLWRVHLEIDDATDPDAYM